MAGIESLGKCGVADSSDLAVLDLIGAEYPEGLKCPEGPLAALCGKGQHTRVWNVRYHCRINLWTRQPTNGRRA